MTSSPGCTMARMAVRMAWVAPAVMVISLSGQYRRSVIASILVATAWRSVGMPGMGGYWLCPARMAWCTASIRVGSQSKSGKPWPRFTAPCSAASADMTLKMVVPTWGRRLVRTGVRSVMGITFGQWALLCRSDGRGAGRTSGRRGTGFARPLASSPWRGKTRSGSGGASQFVVIHLAAHGAGHEFTAQAVAQQLGELVDEVAQVSAALEGHTGHTLAEQMAHGAHHQVAQRVFAHGHLGHDADPQPQAYVGLDDVGVDGF